MLSTRLGAPRRAPGDGDGPSPRSSAPSAARRPQHFHTGCTAGKSVLSGSRRRPTSQPVRPLQGRPEANPTAARSCDGTAVSTHWLRPRAPYTLLSRQGAPLIPLLTPPPSPDASVRRCRPMRWQFIDALPPLSSSPHLKEGGEVLTGRMSSEAPVSSPITEKGTRPAELFSQ